MTSRLQTIAVAAPEEALLPIFERDLVAIVMEDGSFLGLITRIDLLNHLRRKLKEA
jgi:cystathionine beta-synthase